MMSVPSYAPVLLWAAQTRRFQTKSKDPARWRLNFVPNAYRMLSVRNTARLYEAARERGHGVSYLLDPEEKK